MAIFLKDKKWGDFSFEILTRDVWYDIFPVTVYRKNYTDIIGISGFKALFWGWGGEGGGSTEPRKNLPKL